MRWLLLLLIRAYWALFPRRWRRDCLFHETCSVHVFRVTETQGLREGFKALRTRFRQCRGGYRLQWLPDGSFVVRLADGALLPQSEASDSIIRTLRDGAALPMPDLEKIGFLTLRAGGFLRRGE